MGGLSDQSKVTELYSFLTDKALLWATVVWEQGDESVLSYDQFVSHFGMCLTMLPGEGRFLLACSFQNREIDRWSNMFCSLGHRQQTAIGMNLH